MLKLYVSAQNFVSNALARTKDEDGQTMAEYAVVLAVITVVILAALQLLAGGIGTALGKVTSILSPGP